jgi:hypothetical protein
MLLGLSCSSENEPNMSDNGKEQPVNLQEEEPLSDNEDIDPTLLVGEWDCIKFAYISDDNTVSDVTVLSKGHIIIPNMIDRWTFVHTNEIFYNHSFSEGNLIKFTMSGSTFVIPPQEEEDICEALENAYSFAIIDNELIIYFTEIENKNLLILKKR